MNTICKFVKSNTRQLFDILILIAAIIIPFLVDLQKIFEEYLNSNILSPDNLAWHIMISCGGYIASIILFLAALVPIRKFNNGFIMNRIRVYHNYCYAWYLFCAKVLGIKKCDLVLVPIYMQFKLIINGTFDDYPLDEKDYPIIENEPECKITKEYEDTNSNKVNLVLEDTYVIRSDQIPISKRGLLTIKISRNNGSDNGRHYSEKFIDATINQVRKFNKISTLNVFATTNPLNTINLSKRVFALGNRGNIEHLYVFQQNNDDRRVFGAKGHKIY